MLDDSTRNLLTRGIDKIFPQNKKDKLTSAIRYSLFAPAKYIRPFLVIESFKAFTKRPIEEVLPAALAIEFIHTYSLIHDDLPCMDNSDYRRGQLSCHKKFGEGAAVLAGDALLVCSFEVLSSLDIESEKKCKIIGILAKAAGTIGMLGGQILDITSKNTDFKEVKKIHYMKTAELFGASCKTGAIVADSQAKYQEALHNYGVNLGLIFQVRDDISDSKQDNVNNSAAILSEREIESYIDNLYEQADKSLKRIPENTDSLRNLLKSMKNV